MSKLNRNKTVVTMIQKTQLKKESNKLSSHASSFRPSRNPFQQNRPVWTSLQSSLQRSNSAFFLFR